MRWKPEYRLWAFVIAAFLLLIAGWVTLIVIAESNQPATIEINR